MLSAGRLFAAGIQALTLVLLARAAGPSAFGLVAIALGVGTLAQVVFDLGISPFLLRERASHTDSPWIPFALRLYRFSTVLLMATGCLTIVLLGLFIDESVFALLPLVVGVAFERQSDAWAGIAISDGDVRISSGLLLARRVLILLTFLMFSNVFSSAVLAFSVASAIGSLVVAEFARRLISKRIGPLRSAQGSVRELLVQTRSLWANSVGAQLRNIDALLVGMLAGPTQAGFYGLATRVSSPLTLVAASMSSIVLPRAARSVGSEIPNLVKLISFVSGLSVALYLLLLCTADWIVPLVFGPEFLEAVLPFKWLLVGLMFSTSGMMLTAFLQGRRRHSIVARISVVTSTAFLISVAILSPYGGAVATAICMAITMGVQFIVLLVIFVKEVKKTCIN